jgi:predicted ATPase
VPDAVAAVLGITQQPGKTVSESVAAALEGRIRLLVIDNCEHLLDAAADLIEAILAQSATVRLLATSREGLGLPDEQVWPVRSLDAAAGINSPAVSLFVERAQGIAPSFSMVDGDEATAVTEICQRLDGIPLAIELAASRMTSMTASEMRERLDHRLRLLVGARRGSERHQTLRHAVAWSYDLLDGAEKGLLNRCAVFSGGFDLESACAVAGSDDVDDFGILDLLEALVRSSLIIAVRSSGRMRFSVLETIRQFAEEHLIASGAADEARNAHARYFAGRETDILALWDSPRQRETYDWFATELANLRTAFRWAADHGDLDVAAAVATYAAFFGMWVENLEPIAWVEELLQPAQAVDHPRLPDLYGMASQCWMTGHIDAALSYCEAGHALIGIPVEEGPYGGIWGFIGNVYIAIGELDRAVDWYRAYLARTRDTHTFTRVGLGLALAMAGRGDEAIIAVNGLIETAEATRNPLALSYALFADGLAFRDANPNRAGESLRRGLVIAEESGNRANVTHLAATLCRQESQHGDRLVALDNVKVAIRNYHDSGNPMIRIPLAVLVAFFDRLGRRESAATIAGFAFNPLTAAAATDISTAIAHLRTVLGDESYESLARKGETMTTAEIVTYAYDQIDQARAHLKAVAK